MLLFEVLKSIRFIIDISFIYKLFINLFIVMLLRFLVLLLIDKKYVCDLFCRFEIYFIYY